MKKKKQHFELNAPDADHVMLVGDFTNWQESPIPMKRKGKNGIWQASLPLRPGTYGYRFLVDDQWADDPVCPLHVANPYGSQNAVVQIT